MIDERTAPYGALLLRLALGIMFLAHGLVLKVFVFGIGGTVGFFGSLGLPAVFAYLTILAEIGAGVLLILGVLTRLVSLATLPILLGSIFLVHISSGWVFSAPGGGWEYPAFLSVAVIVQALLGDGAYALGPKLFGGRETGRLAAA